MTQAVVIYERTSGDEEGTGQDVKARAARVRAAMEREGVPVLGVFVDDGVSGSVNPFKREGFRDALTAAKLNGCGIVTGEISRFTREHPVVGLTNWRALAEKGHRLRSLAEPHFDTIREPDDEQGAEPTTELLRFVSLWSSWQERVTGQRRTAEAMAEIVAGRRPTKSGRRPGRPAKQIPREELEMARAWVADGMSLSKAARELSKVRGAADAARPEVRKRRTVSRQTLERALLEFEAREAAAREVAADA